MVVKRTQKMLEILGPSDRAAFEQQCFEAWMVKVDEHLVAMCGLSSSCLPDYMYRDAYDDGEPPKRTAKAALAYAKES